MYYVWNDGVVNREIQRNRIDGELRLIEKIRTVTRQEKKCRKNYIIN